MGADGSRSPTNAQHLRATARFSSHFTEVCEVDSHVSRRFPTIRLKNRRTFALFTKKDMKYEEKQNRYNFLETNEGNMEFFSTTLTEAKKSLTDWLIQTKPTQLETTS